MDPGPAVRIAVGAAGDDRAPRSMIGAMRSTNRLLAEAIEGCKG
jgi:hypothetical protein